jgi:DNA-binding transcriptional LysR family regulator
MDRLEESVGGQLLERGPGGVMPTPLGELLYAHARLIRDELQLAERHIRGPADPAGRAFAFGTLPSLAANVVPKAICKWRESHPNRALRIVEKIQLELLLCLMRGEVDFIIGQNECYGIMEGLKQRVLFHDRLYVIARSGHPVVALEAPSWAVLAQFPWVVPMIGKRRTLLEKLLTSEGIDVPLELTQCESAECMKSLVAGSDSLALLPASAVASDVREGRVKTLDISLPQFNRGITLIFHERFPLIGPARELVAHIEAEGRTAPPVSAAASAGELVCRVMGSITEAASRVDPQSPSRPRPAGGLPAVITHRRLRQGR